MRRIRILFITLLIIMAITFPTTLDSLSNPSSSGTLSSEGHSTLHGDERDAIEALETKVGVDSSDVATSLDYRVTTLENAETETFNVKEYGAIGDGSTDDTAAIESAITAAVTAGGGIVLFPTPTSAYIITEGTIDITSSVGIKLKGQGKTVPCLKTAAQSTDYLIRITGDNVIIEDMRFDGLYTSGATSGTQGLIDIIDAQNVQIINNYVTSSVAAGIRLYGDCSGSVIRNNTVTDCYCAIYHYANTTSNAISSRLNISDNYLSEGWDQTGNDQTGGIKFAIGDTDISAHSIMVSNNHIVDAGCLGIELWGGGGSIYHSVVSNNIIEGTDTGELFGISLNDTSYSEVIGNVVRIQQGAYGIEIADQCLHTSVIGNTVNMNDADGVQSATAIGIVLDYNESGGTGKSKYSVVEGNNVTGCDYGILAQRALNALITGNFVYDCDSMLAVQSSDYQTFSNNYLLGPCEVFFFVDGSAADITDISFTDNILVGNATSVGVYGYNNSGTNTITNLKVTRNNVVSATTDGSSYLWSWSADEMINLQQHDNYYTTGGTALVLSDYSAPAGSNPYDWQSWTPTWTNLTVGSATVTGKYLPIGKMCSFVLAIKLAADSSISGSVSFTLPLTAATYGGTASLQTIGSGRTFDNNVSTSTDCQVVWKDTTHATINAAVASGTYTAQTEISATVPFTWAENDEICIQGFYQLA